MKAAPFEPPLVGPCVAASKCVNMVAAAMAWRCGETFSDRTAAMKAFAVKNCSKPSELQPWMDKLARLATHQRVGAQLTTFEQPIFDARQAQLEQEQQQERERQREAAEAADKKHAEWRQLIEATTQQRVAEQRATELKQQRDSSRRKVEAACDAALAVKVAPSPADVRALADQLAHDDNVLVDPVNCRCREGTTMKDFLGAPEWEKNCREKATRILVDNELRAVGLDALTLEYWKQPCAICDQRGLQCDHKLAAAVEASDSAEFTCFIEVRRSVHRLLRDVAKSAEDDSMIR